VEAHVEQGAQAAGVVEARHRLDHGGRSAAVHALHGEIPSDKGVPALRPSGVAPIKAPNQM
jgi:hypothetical protein